MKTLKELNSKWYWRIIKITFIILTLLILAYQLSTLFRDFSERKMAVTNVESPIIIGPSLHAMLIPSGLFEDQEDSSYEMSLEKNNDILKKLTKLNQLTQEDVQYMLDQQKKGISRETILGEMVVKKRYQLGTRAFAGNTKLIDSAGNNLTLISKNNFSSLFSASEIDSYLATKGEIPPEGIELYKKKKEQGMTGEKIKQEIALHLLQKDIKNELYRNKSNLGKILVNGERIVIGTSVELVASIPHFFGFIINLTSLDPIEQNRVGKFINNGTNEVANKIKRAAGIDTGEITGNIDSSILVRDILDFLLPFLLFIFIIRSISYYIIFGKIFPAK